MYKVALIYLGKYNDKFVSMILPFNAQEDTGVPFHRNLNSILRRDHQKNFL